MRTGVLCCGCLKNFIFVKSISGDSGFEPQAEGSEKVMCNFMTTPKFILVILSWTSVNLFSQTILEKNAFYMPPKTFPKNYKAIVGDQKGWRAVGHYNLYTGKIDLNLSSWDTLAVFAPFKNGRMFTKMRRHKIVVKGDKRVVDKIIYVDETTLILQTKRTEKIHHKSRRVKIRTLYKQRT